MFEHVVVGGGIVGLAVGCALSRLGSTAVLERHADLISETSSRNSGVVHAGIYYAPNSLKTQLCIEGNENMWRMVDRFEIKARKCGKFIGSTSQDEDAQLAKIAENMRQLQRPFSMVSQKELFAIEPLVKMRTVLRSSSTGIVDVCSLRDFFVTQIQNSSSLVQSNCNVETIELHPGKCRIVDHIGGEIEASHVILCSGLNHEAVWSSLRRVNPSVNASPQPLPPLAHHKLHFCRGSYVGYRKRIVNSLVYPCPLANNKGMGVHSTIDLDGNVKFGPDAEYVTHATDLSISKEREALIVNAAYEAVRRYIPSIEKNLMFADFSGMRPKLSGEGEPARDFVIERCEDRLVALAGIESPGLTAATAIGDMVARLIYGPGCGSCSLWAP